MEHRQHTERDGPGTTAGGLGLSLPTRSGSHGAELARLARHAEAAGFAAVYIAERVADSLAACHQVLAATSTVTVGTAVANARLRPPALAAMTAMALQEASGGRFVLGLGVANAQLNEGRLGMAPMSPLAWMEEYVEVVRRTCVGGPVHFSGRWFQVDALELDRSVPVEVPVHLAALQDGMLALAGRVADGVILNLCPAAAVGDRLEVLAAQAGRRDPARPPLEVACVVPCCVSDDAERARAAARDVVLDYVLHPAAAKIFGGVAEPDEVAAVQSLLRAGDRQAAAGRLSGEMLDAFVVHGSPSACAEGIRRYQATGLHRPILFPRPVDRDWATPVWELAAALSADDGGSGARSTRVEHQPEQHRQPSSIGGST